MTRFALQRAGIALARFGIIAFALLALIEVAYCVLGGSSRHVWLADSFGDPGPLFTAEVVTAMGRSTMVFVAAYLLVLVTGYGWGTVGARYRRFRIGPLLVLPFSLIACASGFWLVLLVAAHAVYAWQRPGFADAPPPDGAASLLSWWHLSVLAAVAAVGWISRMIAGVAAILRKYANEPYLRSLYIRGYVSDAIFYGNAFRQARVELAGQMAKPVASLLGVLAVLEYAYRFEGAGALFIEASRDADYAGIVAAGSWMTALAVTITWIKEIIEEGARGRSE